MSRSVNRGLVGDRVMVDPDEGLFLVPCFDRLLVEPYKTREVSRGGIIIPDEAKIEETLGKVVSSGYGTFDEKNQFVPREPLFAPGDIIVFKEYTGVHITLYPNDKPKTYILMWDRDVLGVIRKVAEETNE